MATRPDRYAAFAADPALSASERAEPAGTAAPGYPSGSPVPHEAWNWLMCYNGGWGRYLDESSSHWEDANDPGTGFAYRLSPTAATATIAGGLVQPLAQGATYLCGSARLLLDVTLAGNLTYTASTINYVHIKSGDPDSRSPAADVYVSTNATEVGYYAILKVTTDVGSVTACEEVPGAVFGYLPSSVPQDWTGYLHLYPSDPNANALRVRYDNTVVVGAAVSIEGQAGATPGCLDLVPDAASAFGIQCYGPGSGTNLLLDFKKTGVGTGVTAQIQHTDGGTALFLYADEGAAATATGRALTVSCDNDAAGAVFQAVSPGAQAPVRILPTAWDPNTPTDGDVWIRQGSGSGARCYQEGGTVYQEYASQDGPNLASTRNVAIVTIGAATGPINLATLNYYFRNGGTYRIRVGTLQGRTAWSTCIPQYTVKVAGVVQPGLNLVPVDVATGGSGVGNQMVSSFWDEIVYIHGGADGVFAITFDVTTTAGTNSYVAQNRAIVCDMVSG